jgi:large subunit ribosomal protein L25
VLAQELRELTIEALPGDIPDVISHDVSGAEMNATIHLSELARPRGVTLIDDPEAVVATITLPTAEPAEEELEVETELVGEAGAVAEGQAEGDTAEEAQQSAGDS